MIIDFLGTPGCGKTYLVNSLVERTKHRQIKCVNITENSRSKLFWKIKFKVYGFISLIYFHKLYKHLSLILKNYQHIKPKYSESNVRAYLRSLILRLYLYRLYNKKKDLYVQDEGVLQLIATICVNFNVDENSLREMISLFVFPQTIFLNRQICICKDNIKKRNRHVCAIDELKDTELDEFLSLFKEKCEFLCSLTGNLITVTY